MHQHNTAKNGAHYTKVRRPVILKYSKKFSKYSKARSREAELKKLTRMQKEDLLKNI